MYNTVISTTYGRAVTANNVYTRLRALGVNNVTFSEVIKAQRRRRRNLWIEPLPKA